MDQTAPPIEQPGNPPGPTGIRRALSRGRNTNYVAVASPLHHARTLPERLSYLHDLLRELVARDLNLRFKRSYLGVFWSLLTPLVQLLVLRFVFTVVLPLDIPNYTAFLFSGLLVWTWLSTSLDQAAGSIVESRELIRLTGFPVAILPVVTVASNLIQLLFALPILGIFLWFGSGVGLSAAPLLLPLLLGLQFLFTLSVAYLVAALHVTFRDVKHLLGIALTLGFYLTPVFYQVKDAPERYAGWYALNPMVHLLEGYRSILLHGTAPPWSSLAWVAAASCVLLAFSFRLFVRASHHFADEL